MKIISLFFSCSFLYLNAQIVSTVAGTGDQGFVDGIGTSAQFYFPKSVVVTPDETIYVADQYNRRIRKITPDGIVTTFAGSSTVGFADGIGTSAQFWNPTCLALGVDGTLYVTDGHRIRKITTNGVVTTLAGSTYGYADNIGVLAKFDQPTGITVDTNGTIYVADTGNHRIRKVTPTGVVTTLAGSSLGYSNGSGTSARFNNPGGIVVAPDGNIFITDTGNFRIRTVTPLGIVTTFAGSGSAGNLDGIGTVAQFWSPIGITMSTDGTIYVADSGNHQIRKIDLDATVTTVAGNGYSGFADGVPSISQFHLPSGIAVTNLGIVYVADNYNNRIRKITTNLATISNELENQMLFYPNPVKSNLQIALENFTTFKIIIFDINGRILKTENIYENKKNIDLSNLKDGIYLMQIITEKGTIYRNILKN
jgi:sugar lactone lactonase YvrE